MAGGSTRAVRQSVADWCSAIPGLQQLQPHFWAMGGEHGVSFPDQGHADLVTIEAQSYWFRHRNEVIASVVRRFPPAGPIFDIGGGNGFVSLGLRAAGFEAVVIEPGATGAAVARQRGLPVIRAALESLELPDEQIPAVGMFDVLEHIEQDATVLTRLHRAIRPGGMIYVAVPAYNFLWSEQDRFGGHFRRYTLSRLTADLRRAGFERCFGSYFFAGLVPAVFAFRRVPSLFHLRRGDDAQKSGQEHLLPDNVVGRLLARSFAWEESRVASGHAVGFGTSCLVAARKV